MLMLSGLHQFFVYEEKYAYEHKPSSFCEGKNRFMNKCLAR